MRLPAAGRDTGVEIKNYWQKKEKMIYGSFSE